MESHINWTGTKWAKNLSLFTLAHLFCNPRWSI